jgi:hypothetical protein
MTPVDQRLDAYQALDELSVVRQCTCKPPPKLELAEERTDRTRADVIRTVARS